MERPKHKSLTYKQRISAKLTMATGFHLLSSQDHLHQEYSLSLKEHNELLNKQYVLSCHISQRPCKNVIRSKQTR